MLRRHLQSMPSSFLVLIAFFALQVQADDRHDRDPDLFHFKTRPDLKPPRWEITVHDEDRISEGYWFVGVKPSLETTIGTHQGWFGPHIYDGEGELVWSGSGQFDTSNVMDYRLSHIGGKDQMTVLDRDRKIGVIIDQHYEIIDTFPIDYDHDNINGHELRFFNNGSSVLIVRNSDEVVPKEEAEAIGWDRDEPCMANYNSFRELNSKDHWRPLFEWSALGHIRLEEGTETDGDLEGRCRGPWDFIHANSLDKTDDGNYLLSARHTDTIYKISSKDGSILWRLGGKGSDFDMQDLKFSRQHNIRFRGQNETHTLISFLDNAKGQDSQLPTHSFSRGLSLALNTESMTVTTLNTYDHPYKHREEGRYADRRGNMDILQNGNVFMGWSESALKSEYSPDGEILFEAVFKANWLGAYRNYKFPFTGRPLTKPDVYAVSYFEGRDHEHLPTTDVAVSWNGDTEVKVWKLYAKTSLDGDWEAINEFDRTGFETSHSYAGYLTSVRWQGLDAKRKVITDSGEVKTIQHPSPPPEEEFQDSPDAQVEQDNAEDDEEEEEDYEEQAIEDFLGNPNVTFALLFIIGFMLSAFAVLLAWLGYLPLRWQTDRSRGRGKFRDTVQYKKVADEDFDQELGQELPYSLAQVDDVMPVEPP